jgi:hypothetical protein
MDMGKVIHHRRDGQGATRKYYKENDGSLALAVEIAPNATALLREGWDAAREDFQS